jgi:hypothetical protein
MPARQQLTPRVLHRFRPLQVYGGLVVLTGSRGAFVQTVYMLVY